MTSWVDFYNSEHSLIYVNGRHFDVHYRAVADGIVAHIPSPGARVLDYGCGEALHADKIAEACGHLALCDAAPNVRAHLQTRNSGNTKISVLSPDEVAAQPEGSFDLIVMHSVAQYLGEEELLRLFALFRRLLKPGGAFVLGDVVPPGLAAPKAALSLLRFAAANGFFFAAVKGIARIALSPSYSTAALSYYDEGKMLAKLEAAGFSARRAERNIGHNQSRMAFVAQVNAP